MARWKTMSRHSADWYYGAACRSAMKFLLALILTATSDVGSKIGMDGWLAVFRLAVGVRAFWRRRRFNRDGSSEWIEAVVLTIASAIFHAWQP